ncbi:ABC transporter substrate-binding protein [Rhodospirillaceae bacterium KN72]|uniref:ABC transporter substrate-binding protein n=1 Tax=Pacificispira spongiicola TaxID=2729598 RepID=A0A7Y0DXD1_9PROT|nr:ABC transporter substrate-binding protein [Pacificispira spongiicola]NMM43188.1 ABC transporter substrate-binding protein [Pacificispira spongiicola]
MRHSRTVRHWIVLCLWLIGTAIPFGQVASAEDQALDWDRALEKARGQTVYWNAWGGDDSINAYVDWVGQRVKEDYGVTLVHVKVGDISETVRRILAEKAAGRDSGGSVDLMWINGENFKAMKDNGLLFGPFADALPNRELIDTQENPAILRDFTVPTDGYESPWGGAKLIFVYDTARLANPPRDAGALLAYATANPGRVTYPAPPNFLGTTFLKQVLYELVEDPSELLSPAGQNFDAVTAPLWDYLSALHPTLWREGRDYPATEDDLIGLLDDGSVDIALAFNPAKASNAIEQDRLVDTARTYVPDAGSIGNTHYVAIPFNASAKEGAAIVANFLLSPEAQARKQDPRIWGDPTVLSMSRLDDTARALFDDLPRGVATLSPEELGRTLPEPHPTWMTRIEEVWLRRYGA